MREPEMKEYPVRSRRFVLPRTRRDFFKALAASGAAGGLAVLGHGALAQDGGEDAQRENEVAQEGDSDIKVANFALALEFLEQDFYGKALEADVLTGRARSYLQRAEDQENQHVVALTDVIQQYGGTLAEKPQFAYPQGTFSSQASVVGQAQRLEAVTTGAYIGAVPEIQDPGVRSTPVSIAGVEDEHEVAVNDLMGAVLPDDVAFPEGLTRDEVLTAVAPYLGLSSLTDTGGPPPDGQYRRSRR